MRISDWSSDVCSSDLQFLLVGEDDTMPATNKEGTTILDRHFATPPAITAHAALDAETGAYPAALMEVLSPAMTARAREAIQRWTGYAPTPLRRLDRLAGVLDLAAVHYTDECARSDRNSTRL